MHLVVLATLFAMSGLFGCHRYLIPRDAIHSVDIATLTRAAGCIGSSPPGYLWRPEASGRRRYVTPAAGSIWSSPLRYLWRPKAYGRRRDVTPGDRKHMVVAATLPQATESIWSSPLRYPRRPEAPGRSRYATPGDRRHLVVSAALPLATGGIWSSPLRYLRRPDSLGRRCYAISPSFIKKAPDPFSGSGAFFMIGFSTDFCRPRRLP